MDNWQTHVEQLGLAARRASRQLAAVDGSIKITALQVIAESLRRDREKILDANVIDVENARKSDVAQPLIERLKLSDKKIDAMADSVAQIAAQVDPVGKIIDGYVRPNGLRIQKIRVPLGVVLFFYESRPNVTSDAAALCLKSGNATLPRGGKDA